MELTFVYLKHNIFHLIIKGTSVNELITKINNEKEKITDEYGKIKAVSNINNLYEFKKGRHDLENGYYLIVS
jgi:hypothetical protein